MVKIITPEWKSQNARVKWIISGLDYELLNAWEQARAEEWEIKSDSGQLLSDKQMVILEEIYYKKGR
jgi:hypothetical protein